MHKMHKMTNWRRTRFVLFLSVGSMSCRPQISIITAVRVNNKKRALARTILSTVNIFTHY